MTINFDEELELALLQKGVWYSPDQLERVRVGWDLARSVFCEESYSLYHFSARVDGSMHGGHAVKEFDSVYVGVISNGEDYEKFLSELRVSYNINESDHLSITSLSKL